MGGAVFSCGTSCNMPLSRGVQLVIMGGVAAAGVKLDVVARAVRIVERDGVQVSFCARREVCASLQRGGGGRGGGHGGGGGAVCLAGRCARWGLCLACGWCCLSASRWRTWRWTWWRGWCCLSHGTVCTLGLVFGVHLVLFVGVAVADVEVDMVAGVVLFVVWDGGQVAAYVWRAGGALCRRRGGGRGGGHGGGGCAVCRVGRWASCGLCLACRWCFLSAWRWRTWTWTSWRVWCGLPCGTFRKLPLA